MSRFHFLVVLPFAFLVGCGGHPDLAAVTNAPPGAVSEIHQNRDNDTAAVRVTEGVALAIECKDAKSRPCSFDGTTIDDDSTASFRRAYADIDNQDVYSRDGRQKSSVNRTVFVVTGKKVGTTKMSLRTGYGDVPVTIEVLPAK